MNIRVRINANIRPFIENLNELPQGDTWEVPEGATINDVLNMLKLPEGGSRLMIMLNNMLTKEWDTVLKDGDKVLFTPIIGGG